MATTDLQEALTAVGGAALIQKQIDPVLIEYQRRYAPFVRALPTVKWGSNTYYFNSRDSLPAGGFVTDGGARPVATSVYNQHNFVIRQFQTVGAVTGYAQAVTADLAGNLRAKEISGAHQGLLWDLETALLWGNSAATINGPYPQFDGLDTIVNSFSGTPQNCINAAGAAITLAYLDEIIDIVEQNTAAPVETSDWMFVVSPSVNSKIAQQQQAQQRYVDSTEVAPGLIVNSYRGVPIVKSSFLQPRSYQMGTVTAAAVNAGGSLTAATYYYKVSAVINRFGEIAASAEASATTTGTGIITLSFTPPAGVENSTANLYKVYRSTGAGTETFLGYVDANVAVASDGVTPIVTNQIVDNGVSLNAQNSTGPTQQTVPQTAYVGTNTSLLPPTGYEQSIYLLSRDSDFIVRPYVRDLQAVDLYPTTASPDSLPFAIVSDTTLAVRGPKYLGRLANVTVQV